ncbi:ACP S-malonyltransferase [Buchnera aphidicola]|jgi:[acyl-carrier-protein] S-malonyltransferase|uniref:Malonyl CoA-acyl carrier protein transacylase n=1 Tax=Buchnera aphidicola subsp. Schizaphis graminum (strain Sg) TaxID=198804 RepID=FABD_BUCAP|nr:ACP S-malonyltransferase [Buchnera aphidicola]Q8K9J6.1 RecName: Full=Malonyl CoA-acyl carrier protein transacylase; Short=MCT [Buchnera aphidicola str. Sg (Schizaphis graminum)]AAM67892.1 malonyl coa-acyl carrier protein transacylase [Buchnera aphidicola str. Sg (Schizaphis graminum)]AWI49613.1 [acyl-carrier-protein] S-malonyltransferase [Buchnera aphidicola (Schizaphis graminum)]
MNSFAMLFPGQGSQYKNMLSSFFQKKNNLFKKIFDEASEYVNYNLLNLIKNGAKKKRDDYKYIQSAILTSSIAIYQLWKEKNGRRPALMSGHSLGEYSALVCANAIKFSDALKIVKLRSKLMQKIIINKPSLVQAIIGLDKVIIKNICLQYLPKIVSIASINSDDQIIISGEKLAVREVGLKCKKKGAKYVIKLNINTPIHSQLMKPVSEQIKYLLKSIKIKSPQIPVINNVDVICEKNEKKIKKALVRQFYSTVRWKEIIDLIKSKKIFTMLEIGPNKILSNLIKKNDNITVLNTNNLKNFLIAFKTIH